MFRETIGKVKGKGLVRAVNKIDRLQPFMRGPVRQLSFKEHYSP
jgi:hypothetical protein